MRCGARADARAVDTRQSEPCGYVHRVLTFVMYRTCTMNDHNSNAGGLEVWHGSSAARLIVLSAGEKQFVCKRKLIPVFGAAVKVAFVP